MLVSLGARKFGQALVVERVAEFGGAPCAAELINFSLIF
jgi:hypothetical protein